MNNDFLTRIEQLMLESLNDSVKKECRSILEHKDYLNVNATRVHFISKLNGIDGLNECELNFLQNEEKMDILSEMNLSKSFDVLEKNAELYSNNSELEYKINILKNDYQSKKLPAIVVAEEIYYILETFNFSNEIEKEYNTLKAIYEAYGEDIFISKASFIIHNSETDRFLAEKVNMLISEYFNKDFSRSKFIEELQNFKYSTRVNELINGLVQFTDDKSLYITNENKYYKVDNIYSLIESHIGSETEYFMNLGTIYQKEHDIISEITEENKEFISKEFIDINNLIQSPKYTIIENSVFKISLDKNNIDVYKEDGEIKVKFNNEIIPTSEVYEKLTVSGAFDYINKDKLETINKVVENFDQILNLDFAKNIINRKSPLSSATLFKIDESYSVHLHQTNEKIFAINGVQAKNKIFDALQFDISEGIYNLYYGVDSKITIIKESIEKIDGDIKKLNVEVNKIDKIFTDNLIENTDELKQTRQLIVNEIEKLQEEYQTKIQELKNIQNVSEGDHKCDDEEELAKQVIPDGKLGEEDDKSEDDDDKSKDDEDDKSEDDDDKSEDDDDKSKDDVTEEQLQELYSLWESYSDDQVDEAQRETKIGSLIGLAFGMIGNKYNVPYLNKKTGVILGAIAGKIFGNSTIDKAQEIIDDSLTKEEIVSIKELIAKDVEVRKAFEQLSKLEGKIIKNPKKINNTLDKIYALISSKLDKKLAEKITGLEKSISKVAI